MTAYDSLMSLGIGVAADCDYTWVHALGPKY